MSGSQAQKKGSGINPKRSGAAAPFPHHQHRKPLLADQAAIDFEIPGCQRPAPGGVALGRVKPERDDQKLRVEFRNSLKRDGQRLSLSFAVHQFRRRQI